MQALTLSSMTPVLLYEIPVCESLPLRFFYFQFWKYYYLLIGINIAVPQRKMF